MRPAPRAHPLSGIGRELGELWELAVSGRVERVKLNDIVADAPVDVFEASGPDVLYGIGLNFTRSSVLTFRRPDEGSRLNMGIEQIGGDWSFTQDHREIAIETRSPWLVPHSVTIVCAAKDGRFFVGARNPEGKRWVRNVARDPNVRLRITAVE